VRAAFGRRGRLHGPWASSETVAGRVMAGTATEPCSRRSPLRAAAALAVAVWAAAGGEAEAAAKAAVSAAHGTRSRGS